MAEKVDRIAKMRASQKAGKGKPQQKNGGKKHLPLSPDGHDNAEHAYGRLPDGSTVQMSYDASKQLWMGTLTILSHPDKPIFGDIRSGQFRLLHCLDLQYRKWLKEQEAEKVEPVKVEATP